MHTPRGALLTPHVVHATNGWASHLLPPLRAKIAPVRGSMSAQRPGRALAPSTRAGGRSFVFYRAGAGYDYLTQLPTGAGADTGELMFGGGFTHPMQGSLPDIGIVDDSAKNFLVEAHLGGGLPFYFRKGAWGEEATPKPDEAENGIEWDQGRVKASWSGVLGMSMDGFPWVGRLPPKVARRPA